MCMFVCLCVFVEIHIRGAYIREIGYTYVGKLGFEPTTWNFPAQFSDYFSIGAPVYVCVNLRAFVYVRACTFTYLYASFPFLAESNTEHGQFECSLMQRRCFKSLFIIHGNEI